MANIRTLCNYARMQGKCSLTKEAYYALICAPMLCSCKPLNSIASQCTLTCLFSTLCCNRLHSLQHVNIYDDYVIIQSNAKAHELCNSTQSVVQYVRSSVHVIAYIAGKFNALTDCVHPRAVSVSGSQSLVRLSRSDQLFHPAR
jgi:hypothetical protein